MNFYGIYYDVLKASNVSYQEQIIFKMTETERVNWASNYIKTHLKDGKFPMDEHKSFYNKCKRYNIYELALQKNGLNLKKNIRNLHVVNKKRS